MTELVCMMTELVCMMTELCMRHDRTLSNRTFSLHERFRIIYNEKHSSFRCFFYRGRSVSVQTCILRIFANEIFEDTKGIAPNVFPNILISVPPDNFSPHYQSCFQLKPCKISI